MEYDSYHVNRVYKSVYTKVYTINMLINFINYYYYNNAILFKILNIHVE